MNVRLTEDQKIQVLNSSDLYTVMREVLLRENKIDQEMEHFWTVCLSSVNRILNIELVSLGSVDQALVKPMQVFRIALQKGAVKIIMVHNHPQDNELMPGTDDIDTTDRMIQVGNIVGVKVVDHLIISTDSFFSFDATGLMDKLRESRKWVPAYQEEERIRKEALKIGKQQGLKQGKKLGLEKGLERGLKKGKKQGLQEGLKEGRQEGEKSKAFKMARKMKKDNLPITTIQKYTALTKEEIENL